MACACARRNSLHDGPARRGEGSIPAARRMYGPDRRGADPITESRELAVDPSVAPVGILGSRPDDQGAQAGRNGRSTGRVCRMVQWRARSWRCQRRIVAGATSSPRRRRAGSSRVSAAIDARSVQLIRGRGVCRRRTRELVAQDQDLDLLGRVGSGVQHQPAQELGDHHVDQPQRPRGIIPGLHRRRPGAGTWCADDAARTGQHDQRGCTHGHSRGVGTEDCVPWPASPNCAAVRVSA